MRITLYLVGNELKESKEQTKFLKSIPSNPLWRQRKRKRRIASLLVSVSAVCLVSWILSSIKRKKKKKERKKRKKEKRKKETEKEKRIPCSGVALSDGVDGFACTF